MNKPFRPYLRTVRCVVGIALVALSAFASVAAEMSYVDLINRLTDLEQLAVLPAPGEKTAQWSSYDRKSTFDQASGKYHQWDANGDNDGRIGIDTNTKDKANLVLAEMTGPGCIWRIWSAQPQQGRVKIYLDGAAEPAVDLPFIGYFDGKNAPFNRPALVHTVARGWNNYTPIPYSKSCRIVAEPGWGAYYQFVYQTFAPGTRVPTFKRELSASEAAALDRADEVLRLCDRVNYPGQQWSSGKVRVAGGKTVQVASFSGPRAITAIRMKLRAPASPMDREFLREMALQINWDGEEQPAVWAPFGDFFGTPFNYNYRAYPTGHGGDEWWYSYWYMPFGKSARVRLVNDGQSSKDVVFEIATAPLSRPISEMGRFHAKWHRDALLPREPERQIDWTMLSSQGRGRFAGVMLHIWNPRGGWWGEGDEKFHVDNEAFPSTFGTGSEDYFGYAWCDPALFENAFHNQTLNDGNNKGHVSVNRFHITDNIPFHTRFDGYIEKYYPNSKPTLYAATVYWYLAPGGTDPYRPAPLAERIGYWGPVENFKVPGAIEGEALKILSSTGGNPHEQDLSGFGGQWSNDAHLWWISAKPGDRLQLSFPVRTAGKYKLLAQFTKAPDYGILQLSLDGRKLGAPVDFYDPAVIPTGGVNLGTHEFSAGDHVLTAEIIGANEKAIKNYMFGLDYIRLAVESN